jgi:acetate---CoA ligase (ADP-forming)
MTVSQDAVAKLLAPRRIAIVGATPREHAVGNALIRHAGGARFGGSVCGINPRYEEVEGLPCFASLGAVPETPDCAVMAVSDDRLLAAMEDAVAAGVGAAVILGRLYEAEPSNPPLARKVADLAREAGMALCGANCMGLFNAVEDVHLCMTVLPNREVPGRVAFLSHSGSTWSGLGGNRRQLDISIGVSMGNELATGVGDYIRYLITRPETAVIGVVLETVRDAEGFLGAVDAAAEADIPVVALKLGRSEQGRRFAMTHSGALAGDARVYDAVFRRHNVVRVKTLDEMCDTLELFACGRRPGPGALGIQTDSGGERQLITDLAEETGVTLARFSETTRKALADVLDPGLEPENPVDYWGESGFAVLPKVTRILADAPEVGMVALATNMISGRRILYESDAALEAAHAATDKPCILLANLSGSIDPDEAARLRRCGIPVLTGTQTALQAIGHMMAWHGGRAARPEAPVSLDAGKLRRWRMRLAEGAALAGEEAMALIADSGVAVPACGVATDARMAAAVAKRCGYPVALKTAESGIDHKTDVGGVVLGLADEDALVAAYRTMAAALGPRVLIQAMAQPGVEVMVGMSRDATFGPVMTIAMGGILVELLDDAVAFVPPVAPEEAAALIARLRGAKMLDGVRGRPAADRAALARAVSNLSAMVAVLGDVIAGLDVNPLLVHAQGVTAVDGLVVTGEPVEQT